MNHLTRRGSERGAVAPMAALCLLVVLAMTSYALDLGASWLAKQRLTTASDAAVLAVARTHAAGGDCTTEAAAILHANLASGTVVTCTTSPPAIGATMVQVTSKVDVPFHFAQSMGYSSGPLDPAVVATLLGHANAAFTLSRYVGIRGDLNAVVTSATDDW